MTLDMRPVAFSPKSGAAVENYLFAVGLDFLIAHSLLSGEIPRRAPPPWGVFQAAKRAPRYHTQVLTPYGSLLCGLAPDLVTI